MTLEKKLMFAVAACILAVSAVAAQPPTATPPSQTQTPASPQTPAPAATLDQPPPPSSIVSSGDVDTAIALLDRIDRIVTSARKDPDDDVRKLTPVGTSGSAAGASVKVDAADLDEIHAEVEQIRRLLKPSADAIRTR